MVCFAPGGGERLTGKTGGKLGGSPGRVGGNPRVVGFFLFSALRCSLLDGSEIRRENHRLDAYIKPWEIVGKNYRSLNW